MLTPRELRRTADSITAVQLPTGMVPWFPGGHADPWNHVEALMALTVAGRVEAARQGFDWLRHEQHDDGGWWHYYIGDGVESWRRDTNVVAYVATGVWHHWLLTGDRAWVVEQWPMMEAAIEFVLRLQQPTGEITWCYEPGGEKGDFALLTSSSSIFFSLRCAIAIADVLGEVKPHWELAAAQLRHAVAHRPDRFEPKERWAMDWYYPVLSGAVAGEDAVQHLKERWDTFVMPGLGVRCVSDRPWTTAAETAECAMALDACDMWVEAEELLRCIRYLRDDDGAYYTGMVHPQRISFPGGERSTYTAAAIILAHETLFGEGPASRFFTGASLPDVTEIDVDPDPVP